MGRRQRNFLTRIWQFSTVCIVASCAIGNDYEFDKDVPTPTLLESLWHTFKQTMEMTTSALSSQKQNGQQNAAENPSDARATLSMRRISLVKKTLQDHYTQTLVDSSPQWDGMRMQSSRAREGSKTRQNHRQPLRWTERNKKGEGCYFFSENAASYWSYQWCQEAIVMQGFRTKENGLDVQHLLGSYVPFQRMGVIGSRDYAQKFAREVNVRFPNAMIELYQNGDPCSESSTGPASRRMAVVLRHDQTSKFCSKDWTATLNDPAIESIEEPYECRYLIHVCRPSLLSDGGATHEFSTHNPPITQSDAKELNQTMTNIRNLLQDYLPENSADTQRKAKPHSTTSLHVGLPPLPQSRVQTNLDLIRDMFQHAYDSYMYNAFPASDIKPITCQPTSFDLVRIPGLTLIDSLDTLIVMGNYTEFARAVERLRDLNQLLRDQGGAVPGGIFALNQNVSLFETNIRVLGGLLSAHQMAEAFLSEQVPKTHVWDKDASILIGNIPATTADMDCSGRPTIDSPLLSSDFQAKSSLFHCRQKLSSSESIGLWQNSTTEFWKYDGFLLDLAQDIGDRLLPAFSTKTGIPYGTVNLLSGIPRGETTVASLAGGGTLSLEMELLSRLTGNPHYGRAAKLATRALWMRRSRLNLLGKHICTHRGEWTETLSGIGSNSDSFYEYLIKHHILFPEDDDFWAQLVSTYGGVYNESRVGEWYGDVDFHRGQNNGGPARRVFEALMAFYPGMQVLLGELTPAARSLNSFFLVREHLGFLPERFNYALWRVDVGGGHHFLRPELLESAYFMHRASKGFLQSFRGGLDTSIVDTSGWHWAADFALHTLEDTTRTSCGYASLKSVSSALSSEPINDDSPSKLSRSMMNEMPSFFLSETLKYVYLIFDEENVLHKDTDRDWVFTTEAHPIHYVSSDNAGAEELGKLQGKLVERLRAKAEKFSAPLGSSFSTSSYKNERWTDATSFVEYFNQTTPIALEVEANSRARTMDSSYASHGPRFWAQSQAIESIFLTNQVSVRLDFFHESLNKQSAAYLTFSKLGNQWALTNSCQNFYLSDWRWIRALNGGGSDYSDVYVSSVMDRPATGDDDSYLTGSMDTLSLHGSGVQATQLYGDLQKCAIVERLWNENNRAAATVDEGRLKDSFDMGGELGQFEVSAFQEGSGFFIQRSNSEESLVATLIHDEANETAITTYVMVYATAPLEKEIDAQYENDKVKMEDNTVKSVVMADLNGNSFACQVEVFRRHKQYLYGKDETGTENGDSSARDGVSEEDTIAVYPCAPAMFGPVHMTELAQLDEVRIESTRIQGPNVNRGFGCGVKATGSGHGGLGSPLATTVTVEADGSQPYSERDTPSTSENSGSINLVHRGACTFEEKALIQKSRFNAKAVIVINSEEDELFVMSGGGSNDPSESHQSSEFPPTVLVSGADGKALDLLTKSGASDEVAEVAVRISIIRDQTQIVESKKALSVQNNLFWPVVRARNNAVQIFTRGGWGVHAVQRSNDNDSMGSDWQLFLFRHHVHFDHESDDVIENI